MSNYFPISFTNRRNFVALFLIASMLSIIGSYFYFAYEQKNTLAYKNNELKAIADLKISQIKNWNNERVGDAKTLSLSPYFIESIEKFLSTNGKSFVKSEIINQFYLLNSSYGYENILLVDDKGKILLSIDSTQKEIDYQCEEFIKTSTENKRIVSSDLFYCRIHKKIHFDYYAPIINEKKSVIAIIVLRINPESYLYPLIQSLPTPSKSFETLIIRKDGDSVVFLNNNRFRKNSALRLRIPLTDKAVPAVRAVEGFMGIVDGVDYRGENVISYVDSIPGTNWLMVAKIDKSELYSDIYYKGFMIISFTLLLIIALSLGFTWFNYYRQRNIYRNLWKTQEEFKTTLISIGDAVITTSEKGIVQFINPVAQNLTGWKEPEARSKHITSIFKIISEDTRIIVDNPVDKVIKEGLIVGLANHTLLISKDGKEIPIADSGAPIKDENGNIIGAVLVFRDQSEERLNQRLLSVRVNLYEFSAVHSIDELFTKTLDELEKLTKSSAGSYYLVSPDQEKFSLCALSTGTIKEYSDTDLLTEAVFTREPVIHNDLKPNVHINKTTKRSPKLIRELVIPVLRNKLVVSIICVGNKPTNYTEKDVEIITFLGDLAWEIMEKKRSEQELIQSEIKFRNLFNNSEIGMFITRQGSPEILDFNKKFLDTFGYSLVELIGKQTISLWVNKSQYDEIMKLLKLQGAVANYECDLIKKNGDIINCITSIKLFPETGMIEGSILDITDKKRAVEKILKADRILTFISQINQTIVRLKDKIKLYEEVCKIAVEYGKFQMAWIGVLDEQTGIIIPIAKAGYDKGYLSNIPKISIKDIPEGKGPTARAIREGKYILCDDIENDPNMIPWREEALKRNFRSSISLPIKLYNKVIGAYSLYSSIPGFFNEFMK